MTFLHTFNIHFATFPSPLEKRKRKRQKTDPTAESTSELPQGQLSSITSLTLLVKVQQRLQRSN